MYASFSHQVAAHVLLQTSCHLPRALEIQEGGDPGVFCPVPFSTKELRSRNEVCHSKHVHPGCHASAIQHTPPHMPHCLGPFLNSSHPCVVCIEPSLKRWQCSSQRSHSRDVLSNDMEVVLRTTIIKRFRGVRGPMSALLQALLAVWCQERTARS